MHSGKNLKQQGLRTHMATRGYTVLLYRILPAQYGQRALRQISQDLYAQEPAHVKYQWPSHHRQLHHNIQAVPFRKLHCIHKPAQQLLKEYDVHANPF